MNLDRTVLSGLLLILTAAVFVEVSGRAVAVAAVSLGVGVGLVLLAAHQALVPRVTRS